MKSNFTFSLPALVFAALGGCMTPLQDLDLSLKRPSAQGRFVVSMQPPASAPTYLIEGMKFSMAGWWEMKLAIQTPEGTDNVTFNTLVTDPAAKR